MIPNGYNLCSGGNTSIGYQHTPQSRLKMSLSKKKSQSMKGKNNHFTERNIPMKHEEK